AGRETAGARREALRKTADYTNAVSAAANAEQLAQRARDAENTATRSANRAQEAKDAVGPAADNVQSAAEDLEGAERTVVATADNVAAQAVSAGLAELTSRHLPTRDNPRLRQGARLRAAATKEAVKLMTTHAGEVAALETATGKAAEARAQLAEAEEHARRQETSVADAVQATAE